MDKYERRFKELNKKEGHCCNGECYNNYVSEKETLVCGNCEKEKHMDYFAESKKGYVCEECESIIK